LHKDKRYYPFFLTKTFGMMKKGFLTLMAIMLTTVAVMAQAQFGVRAGFNVATVSESVAEFQDGDEPWRPGFNIGLASQFTMGEMFSIAPELYYSQRGYLVEYLDDAWENNVRYDYLNLPVMFRLAFGDVLKGYINAGPTFGYFLGGRYKMEGSLPTGVDERNEKIVFEGTSANRWDLDASRLEFGGAIGGGVMLDTEGGSFLIDLRYNQGFTQIANFADDDGFKNRVVNVSLIYLVPSVR
jgi:hypothetical protein